MFENFLSNVKKKWYISNYLSGTQEQENILINFQT